MHLSIHPPSFRIILTCSPEGSLALLTGAGSEAQREQVLAQSHTLLNGEAGRARVTRGLLQALPSGGLHATSVMQFQM